MAVAIATCKAICLQQLLNKLNINTNDPMPILINNQIAIKLTKNLKFYI